MPPATLTRRQLNRATLARQLLLERQKLTPLRAIERLAGLQAQEARPPFVGLWSRLVGFRAAALTRLLRHGKVVRATMMRGTLHLVSAKDYIALRGSVQPALTKGMQSVLRQRAAAVDVPRLVATATAFLAETPRTSEELRQHLAQRQPKLDPRAMGYAVRTHLPMVQVPTDDATWGFPRDTDFALAEAWLEQAIDLDVDDPAALVLRYLAAFGPATPADAQAWSGLTGLKDVFERLRPELKSFQTEAGREVFDLPRAPRPDPETPAPVRLLPEFDNLVLAHADRTRLIADEHRPKICTKNLRVLPTFLVDGEAAGLWQVERTRKRSTLTLQPFARLAKTTREALVEEAEGLLQFAEFEAEQTEVRVAKP